MNTRQKMYRSNTIARKWLQENNYKDVHFFPHTRFNKDIHFQGLAFDGCASYGKQFVLFQVKTNVKCPKKIQIQMSQAEKSSGVKMLWINVGRGRVK